MNLFNMIVPTKIASYAWLLLTFSTIYITDSHPQCLDYRPPFSLPAPHDVCSQYAQFGCCSNADLDRIQGFIVYARYVMGSRWNTCGHYVSDLLCQVCSPYAAHIYDAESSSQPRTFPGLCQSYCEQFYDSCFHVLEFVDPRLSRMTFSKYDFCAEVAIPQDIDYCYPELLWNPVFNDQISNTQISQDGCLCLEEVLTDLRNPVFARAAGDASGRLFIGEQVGLVYIYYPEYKTGLYTPFFNITERVLSSKREGDERGFFSIAFHPNFTDNGRVFVYYSTNLDANDQRNTSYSDDIPVDHMIVISEFLVSQEDSNQVDVNTERVLMEVDQPYWNHNGGELLFGDDSYLYIFVGDGGNAGDPHGMGQNMSTPLGKILRIDVDTPDLEMPYSIPPDNPFLNMSEALPEIYAFGVRNIWRCGKDKGDRDTDEGKGRILCGDVGQSAWEELDLVKKGANYGWNDREGFACYRQETCGGNGPEELPVYAYGHDVGKSVTGGVFYRGCQYPNLNGVYLYGDYMSGRLFRLTHAEEEGWNSTEVFMCEPNICLNTSQLTGHYERYIISFGEDEQGEIYLLSTATPSATVRDGKMYRIIDPKR